MAAKRSAPKKKRLVKPLPPERKRLQMLLTLNPKAKRALDEMFRSRGLKSGNVGRSAVVCEAILHFARYDALTCQENPPPRPSPSTSAPSPQTPKPPRRWANY